MQHKANYKLFYTTPRIPTPTILFITIIDVKNIDVFYPFFSQIDDYPEDYI